ncbi:hypothetical protein OCU04_012457 [Sclerotinia nivalis]|uniref:Uncharacterized protein n=1 Tax=Sclerotinia nivalis TaxID=352851 RepID=A0A9X0DE60_9HELO|nr:hypothetical protein OCU04_012457 [Sclerotinia nivalis]
MIFGSITTGILLSKSFSFLPLVLTGSMLVVIGGSLMYALVGVDTKAASIYGYSILIALGVGLFTQDWTCSARGKYDRREELQHLLFFYQNNDIIDRLRGSRGRWQSDIEH